MTDTDYPARVPSRDGLAAKWVFLFLLVTAMFAGFGAGVYLMGVLP